MWSYVRGNTVRVKDSAGNCAITYAVVVQARRSANVFRQDDVDTNSSGLNDATIPTVGL